MSGITRIAVTVVLATGLMGSAPSSGSTAPTTETDRPSVGNSTSRWLPSTAVTASQTHGRGFTTEYRPVGNRVLGQMAPGRQTLIKIDSVEAPQRFKFNVSLPRDARLVRMGSGLRVVNASGDDLGRLEAPWAVDATGVRVATRFQIVDRDTFVQVVEHRAVGAIYPVFADPWWVVPVAIRAGTRIVGRYVVRRATYEAAKRAAARQAARQLNMDIDELLAKSPVKLKSLTKANFRENVRRRTNWKESSIKGYDAHHTLPIKFAVDWKNAGFNIHNPVLGHWWCRSAHRSAARAFNAAWAAWLKPRRSEIRNTSAWRNKIETKRIRMVSTPRWADTYQCR